jgi:hypothetical protein
MNAKSDLGVHRRMDLIGWHRWGLHLADRALSTSHIRRLPHKHSVQLRTRRGDEVIHLIFAGLVRNHGVAAIRLTYCYGAYANPVVYSRLFSGTVARTASPEIETIVRPPRIS